MRAWALIVVMAFLLQGCITFKPFHFSGTGVTLLTVDTPFLNAGVVRLELP